jgi:glyoxylase-like metal-dependent hydrolase (beta-lactamase superfamily II)
LQLNQAKITLRSARYWEWDVRCWAAKHPFERLRNLVRFVIRRSQMRRVIAWLSVAAMVVAASAWGRVRAKANPVDSVPQYSIDAIRYATVRDFPVAGLVVGAPKDEKVDIAMVIWLIRGGGHTILFDSGFHRPIWIERFHVVDFKSPGEVVRLAGIDPAEVTDIIISHAHWDHIGGIDLFPKAQVWIQKEEYEYYTGAAWQEGGLHGGIDPDDMLALVKRNLDGKVHLIAGDNVEILPGIRAYTGARHTYASQYIRVDGNPPFVLASDNCYLYRNLETHAPIATFLPEDHAANLAAQARMVQLAGSADRVVPGHDLLQFQKFPTRDRVAHIR